VNRQQCSFANSICWTLRAVVMTATLFVSVASAQNPVPQIVGPVKPMAVAPGSGPFTLSVYGANFVPGAVVTWNEKPRKTTFISGHELLTFGARMSPRTQLLSSPSPIHRRVAESPVPGHRWKCMPRFRRLGSQHPSSTRSATGC